MKAKLLLGIIAALAAAHADADMRFKNIYQNNMVLQANEENIIEGKTDAKGQVDVVVSAKSKDGKTSEKTLKANVDKNGKWAVKTPKFPKRTVLEITAKNAGGETARISNVITGELWLGSGQSNMEWHFGNSTVDKEFLQKYEQDADAMKGDVRIFTANRFILPEPIDEVCGDWRIIDGKNLRHGISQICYIFASQISKALDTPVGVINSSWGGSRIEPWISKEAYKSSNVSFNSANNAEFKNWQEYEDFTSNYAKLREDYVKNFPKWIEDNPTGHLQGKNRATRPQKPIDILANDHNPTNKFNSMICGVAPLSPKGVLWYQGESNAGQPYFYGDLLKLMVTSWRKHFNRDFYFYYVDLAAFTQTQNQPVQYGSWGGIRETMAEVLELPKTGVATSIDSGGSKINGQGDIHPPHKELVSTRLANMALADVYKKGSPKAARSPRYAGEFKVEGGKLIVKIENAEGLRKMAGKEKLTGFAIRGENPRDWKWADAEIKGDTIVLSSPEVAEPKAARYAWASWPLVSVESKYGLPLLSFSTDNGGYVDWNRKKK
ncbi:MAG: hypothetical protein J6T16_00355 [Opitutales bacterium]|nr:hypothetical protein [Opitutales bacterium]